MNIATDQMQPVPLRSLLHWIKAEYTRHDAIFGIPVSRMFHQGNNQWSYAGNDCALPVGPAAGPHTQLTQNIIAAYLCGGRFFELKTVQKLDQLEIAKPCIDAVDECYNSEWSTELSLVQAWEEYAKAWLLLPLLKELLQPGSAGRPDYVFNISVGYDLAGIRSSGVDDFIENMRNAGSTPLFSQLRDTILQELDQFAAGTEIDSSHLKQVVENTGSCITDSVTLSTMHGCPPDEIEAIGSYLLREKQLHTIVKLNPTLLGESRVRELLEECGYDYLELTAETFSADLSFDEAQILIRRLQEEATLQERNFGVKLSNTLPVRNQRQLLAGGELYLSGRALYPLTVNLAAKLSGEFNGKLPLSFSGGANALNLAALLRCGIQPVTAATDLLKPGGYLRLVEIAGVAQKVLLEGIPEDNDPEAIAALAFSATGSRLVAKELHLDSNTGFDTQLPLFDCRITPCREACPIHQDVPGYLRLMEKNRPADALALILQHNPLPHITGHICDHQCMAACTRQHYEDPLLIRDVKRLAAESGSDTIMSHIEAPPLLNLKPVAIIGAGPAGLAAASFLRRAGVPVTVFDQRENAGGVVQHVIPTFRLPEEAVTRDVDFLTGLGVEFAFGSSPDFNIDNLLQDGFSHILLAIGATRSRSLQLECDTTPVYDAVDFLSSLREGRPPAQAQGHVVVIGGGNTAMDGARAALRLPGVTGVTIAYRRTSAQMPADREEYYAALDDGIQWRELVAPLSVKAGILSCQPMQLVAAKGTGRRGVEPAAENPVRIQCDTLISAIGETVDEEILTANGIELTGGTIRVDENTLATSRAGVFACGDARRGPATVVEAISDGRRVATAVLAELGVEPAPFPLEAGSTPSLPLPELHKRRGQLAEAAAQPLTGSQCNRETERCLACDLLCNRCVDVCPNRTNIALDMDTEGLFKDRFQILHLEALCNECGNCVTFCPHEGAPWREKPTLFSSVDAFNASGSSGFLLLSAGKEGKRYFRVRLEKVVLEVTLRRDGEPVITEAVSELVQDSQGKQLLRLLQLLQTEYEYLLPL